MKLDKFFDFLPGRRVIKLSSLLYAQVFQQFSDYEMSVSNNVLRLDKMGFFFLVSFASQYLLRLFSISRDFRPLYSSRIPSLT